MHLSAMPIITNTQVFHSDEEDFYDDDGLDEIGWYLSLEFDDGSYDIFGPYKSKTDARSCSGVTLEEVSIIG